MTSPVPPGSDRRRFFEDFVDLMYRRKDVGAAFDTFVAPDYIQHNPGLADGRDGARDVLVTMFHDPGFAPEVMKLLVDGDLCAAHLKIVRNGVPVAAVVDFYRTDGDFIVEHWDVIQPWPAASKNEHPMF